MEQLVDSSPISTINIISSTDALVFELASASINPFRQRLLGYNVILIYKYQ